MAPHKTPSDVWKERIKELQRQNELMVKGRLWTREKSLRPDGQPFLTDTTRQSIERNRQWIADLQALLAVPDGKPMQKPKPKPAKRAPNHAAAASP